MGLGRAHREAENEYDHSYQLYLENEYLEGLNNGQFRPLTAPKEHNTNVMSTVLKSGESSEGFTPHPVGSFMAVCCDVFTKEYPNKYKGQLQKFGKNKGKPDEREVIEKVCVAFLTEEMIEIDGEMKPRYASYWAPAGLGTPEFPSNARKFLRGWWPTLDDATIDAGLDLDKFIGRGAYITITHSTDPKGKTWANISNAAQPPKGSAVPAIPADFLRHKDKVVQPEAPTGQIPDNEQMPF